MYNSEDKRKYFLIALLLTACGLLLRYLFRAKYLGEWDCVDFALGLRDYNLAKFQPHPPGYPLYMFFAKLLFFLVKNEVSALTLTSAIFGGLTVLPFYYLALSMYGLNTAVLASVLLLINPLHWLMSTKAFSEGMAVFFIVWSGFFLYRGAVVENLRAKLRFLIAASLTLGLGLGVRLAYFPFLFLWGWVIFLCRKQQEARGDKNKLLVYPFLVLGGTIFIWAAAQASITGLSTFAGEGMNFLRGHFQDWGGTVLTQPHLIQRLKELFIQDILIHGLGAGNGFLRLGLTFFIGISLIFYYKAKGRSNGLAAAGFDFRAKFLLYWLLPYLAWVLLAQNLNNPRHVLAAIPVLLIMISRGFFSFAETTLNFSGKIMRIDWALSFIFPAALFFLSFNLVFTQYREKPAALLLVEYVKKEFTPYDTVIFGNEAKRLFDFYGPEYITVSDGRLDVEEAVAYYFYGNPKVILVTSEMMALWQRKGRTLNTAQQLKLLKEFAHNSYVQNSNPVVSLYRLEKAL